eukprot:CAMPEP_0181462006 /NCGR_PEP_ID=MMETSP1110-20121109/34170_1 /TAXON_ID=174948 /ORGANISM="Symbiodinium sp., Strain CCMP421" /LENGTH=163 /DNA_ID=CAMNT_0023586647 /DNA_START=39 /DNA_END=530 /DNA_ORIENTATION=+
MSSFSGILGASNQYGRWVPEQEITVKAIAGGSTIDFSQALFTLSAYTVYTKAFWGGVTIIVPPGVAVEQNGQAIMGSFAGNGGVYSSATETVQSRATNASITIKVEGTAMWGSVTVAVNERAKPAVVLTPEQLREELSKDADPSTTRQDMVDQALSKALGGAR